MVSGIWYVYWFSPLRNGSAFRVRQRLCEDCFAANVTALLTPENQELLSCSACGISVEDDVHGVYVTWQTKGEDKTRGAMALCEEHALEIRVRASKDSTELPDRDIDVADRFVATPVSATETLHAMGRQDQVRRRRA